MRSDDLQDDAAVIARINQAGFSLAAAGKIAFFFPLDHLLYNIVDPRTILLEPRQPSIRTGLPPRLKKPKADWFEKDKPAKADPENDWLIKIYDGRFVGCIYPEEPEPLIYGDLRLASQFVAWFPFHQYMRPRAERISLPSGSIRGARPTGSILVFSTTSLRITARKGCTWPRRRSGRWQPACSKTTINVESSGPQGPAPISRP